MRVARVEIENHPAIGSIDVDFTDGDGNPAHLVVIAGQNGCGKPPYLMLYSNYSISIKMLIA